MNVSDWTSVMSGDDADHEAWKRRLREKFGARTRIVPIPTPLHTDHVAQISASPIEGALVVATVGAMDAPRRGQDASVEVLMIRRGRSTRICSVAATLGYLIARGRIAAPGVVIEGVLKPHLPEAPLPHIYLSVPFMWPDLIKVELPGRTLHPLRATPISVAEAALVAREGGRALEALWRRRGTDLLNWRRPCAVAPAAAAVDRAADARDER